MYADTWSDMGIVAETTTVAIFVLFLFKDKLKLFFTDGRFGGDVEHDETETPMCFQLM